MCRSEEVTVCKLNILQCPNIYQTSQVERKEVKSFRRKYLERATIWQESFMHILWLRTRARRKRNDQKCSTWGKLVIDAKKETILLRNAVKPPFTV